MANGPLLRVSNVLGTPVFQWVINQLKTRSDNNSKDTRDDSNLIYLANKTGWFRIVSSVRIPEFTATTSTSSKTYDYFRKKYFNDIKDEDSLAKNTFFLQVHLLTKNLKQEMLLAIYYNNHLTEYLETKK